MATRVTRSKKGRERGRSIDNYVQSESPTSQASDQLRKGPAHQREESKNVVEDVKQKCATVPNDLPLGTVWLPQDSERGVLRGILTRTLSSLLLGQTAGRLS